MNQPHGSWPLTHLSTLTDLTFTYVKYFIKLLVLNQQLQ